MRPAFSQQTELSEKEKGRRAISSGTRPLPFKPARNAGTGSVSEQRRTIQSAANGLWPPAPKNHGVRREFALSPTRNSGVSSRPTARRKKR